MLRNILKIGMLFLALFPSVVLATPFGVATNTNDDSLPSVVYNSSDEQFFVVDEYAFSATDHDIRAQRVSSSGTIVGQYLIATASSHEKNPSVAYNSSIANEYLVVWEQDVSGQYNIYARIVSNTGTLGSVITIASNAKDELSPEVIYNPVTNEYLVVYEFAFSATDYDIYAQRVSAGGTLSGSTIIIDNSGSDEKAPDVACNTSSGQYLLTWQDKSGGDGSYGIHGKLYSDITLSGSSLTIENWENDQLKPRIASNSGNNQFLVVWEDHHWGWGDDWDIYGRLVNSNATMGSTFGISWNDAKHRENPDVVFVDSAEQYVVTWEYEYSAADHDVYYRKVSENTTTLGPELVVSNGYQNEKRPALAASKFPVYDPPWADRAFVVWEDMRNSATQGMDIYGDLYEIAGAVSIPVVTSRSSVAITSTTAIVNGLVNPKGSADFYFNYGTTISYGSKTYSETIEGDLNVGVSSQLTGLQPNTLYHYQVAATNSFGTVTGTDMTFTTGPSPSAITLDFVYPSLQKLQESPPPETTIQGSGFDSNTRLSLSPDSGNQGKIIGTPLVTDGRAQRIITIGNNAYVLNYGGTLQIIDITTPAKPVIIGSSEALSEAWDFDIANQVAYVTCGDSTLRLIGLNKNDATTYLKIMDTVTISSGYASVDVEGNKAYVTYSDGIQVIDVTDPQNVGTPLVVPARSSGSFSAIKDVAIYNNRAYLYEMYYGLTIVDVNPGTTFGDILGSQPFTTNDQWSVGVIKVFGSTLYFGLDRKLYLRDLTNTPNNPGSLSVINMPDWVQNLQVVAGTAYVATGGTGLYLVDVSIPSSPTIGGFIDSVGVAYDISVKDSVAYMASYYQDIGPSKGYLEVFDIAGIASPPFYATVDTPGKAQALTVVGNVAYIADQFEGLAIIDVNPSSGSYLNRQQVPIASVAHDVTVDGGMAYVAAGWEGLTVVDLGGPAISYKVVLDEAQGVAVSNGYAYVAVPSYGIKVVDVNLDNNGTDKLVVGTYAAQDSVRRLTVVGNRLYCTGYDGLRILDITDPTTPTLIGTVVVPNDAKDVFVTGGYAYVAAWRAGLHIVNVNELSPDFLSIVGSVPTYQVAQSVYVTGLQAYIAESEGGVVVIDVSDPTDPVIAGEVQTPGWPEDVIAVGGKIYVADGYNGLVITPGPVQVPITSFTATEIKCTFPSPALESHYTLKAFDNSRNSRLNGAVTFTNEINLLSSKAIIVAGGGPSQAGWTNLIWDETKAYANYAYDNLIYQGYRHADITYITDEPTPLARYGSLIDPARIKAATKTNLQSAITSWAASGSSDLLIYMEDHGDIEAFLLNGATQEKVTAAELDTWLDILQATLPGKVIVIYDACRSGSFIYRNRPPSGKTRITLTSSTPDQTAYFLSNNHSFSSHFWSTFSGKSGDKAIMTDAFTRATTNMASYQNGQLDANGNGLPNEPGDYSALAGHEGTIYALRRQYNYKNRSKPVIPIISADQSASGATLMAKSVYDVDGDSITKVWAEIYAPDFNLDPTAQTVTDSVLPTVPFSGPDGNGEYAPTVAPTFPVHGTYIITYYAEDSSGIYSLPKTSLVTQAGGTTSVPPDQYENDNSINTAQPIIVDSPMPQNHSFHVSGDQDWVKFYGVVGKVYNIRAMNPTIISNPIVTLYNSSGAVLQTSNSGISGQEESIIGWTCPVEGTYYVQMTNSSSHFGANVRYKLRVYNPDALSLPEMPGTVSGTIVSGGTGVGGALVSAPGGQPQYTGGNGGFTLFLPAGSHTITVVRDGYQTISFVVTVGSGQNISISPQNMNGAPRIVNQPPRSVKSYEFYNYVPLVIDPDGDSYTFSISGTPVWASFNTGTGQLTGRPSIGDVGTHGPVTISATDIWGAVGSIVFSIDVLEGSGGGLPGIYMLLLKP